MENRRQTYFRSGRFFYQKSLEDGQEDGWFFILRGGDVKGPFPRRVIAEQLLNRTIDIMQKYGNSGHRRVGNHSHGSA